MNHQARIAAPFATLGIFCDGDAVTGIEFLQLGAPALAPKNAPAETACKALASYFQDPSVIFALPAIKTSGTAFQQKVWAEILRIPPGQTLTYKALAERIGSGPRPVANACGANPIPVLIPCHRVVASDGLGGFMQGRSSDSLAIKRWLLAHEGAI